MTLTAVAGYAADAVAIPSPVSGGVTKGTLHAFNVRQAGATSAVAGTHKLDATLRALTVDLR